MDRCSDVDLSNLTPEQQAVADAIAAGPRGSVRGPFVPWLLSPEMADMAQNLGAFLRYRTTLPENLKELAILYTARHWDAEFEWFAHARMALDAGVARDIVEAIGRGTRPAFDNDDEALVYRICEEMYAKHRVGDALFAEAESRLGQRGVMELIGVLGYYVLVSMTLNLFQVAAPDDPSIPALVPLQRPDNAG